MENQYYFSNQTSTKPLAVFIDPEIFINFPNLELNCLNLNFSSKENSQIAFTKVDSLLEITTSDGHSLRVPFHKINLIKAIEDQISLNERQEWHLSIFESFLKSSQNIEKKFFTQLKLKSEGEINEKWNELFKKTNIISKESHRISELIEKVLDIPFLQNFQTSIVILHLKGQTKAELLGTIWKTEKVSRVIEVKDFNLMFNSIKKSKFKSFTSDAFPNINLPFNGSFLAKEIISKHFSLIWITSRHDFLPLEKNEVELFETCVELMQPHFERLTDQEFSNKKVSELRLSLKEFPLPLRICHIPTETKFTNDLLGSDLQDKDIFYNKKLSDQFCMDLYDSDELRHYAFDLFHFQRISLLGELLNTLRHELSNPLFGLKLGAQIYSMLDAASDNKEMMKEIDKNISRCQLIIENFSKLYQEQTESSSTSIRRLIDEALVLSKSETRDIKKEIIFEGETENINLNLPNIFAIQIIFNLIVNASQAMSGTNDKKIQFNISKNRDFVFINIKDSGTGVPENNISSLFKPFFTTKSQGTGLGLVLSRNLALKMGGGLEYINNNTNGAEFRLTLPIT